MGENEGGEIENPLKSPFTKGGEEPIYAHKALTEPFPGEDYCQSQKTEVIGVKERDMARFFCSK